MLHVVVMWHLPNAVGFGGNPGAMCGDFGGSRWEADWEYAVPVVGAQVAVALGGGWGSGTSWACASRFDVGMGVGVGGHSLTCLMYR